MTLTQQNRQRLAGYVTSCRTDWHLAGTTDAISKLALQHPNDDLLVAAKAIAAARDPHARGPAAMLGVDLDKPLAVTPRPTPRATDRECEFCCSQVRDVNGECVGCQQQDPGKPAYLRVGTSPAPLGNRELVAAALGRAAAAERSCVEQRPTITTNEGDGQ